MGRLDVHIRHGGGPSLDPMAIAVIAAVVVLASGGGAVAAGVVSTIVSLLWMAFWTAVAVIVVCFVLCVVFRKRIARNIRPTQVKWVGRTAEEGALPRPEPAPAPESGPREVHYHFHEAARPSPATLDPGHEAWMRRMLHYDTLVREMAPRHEMPAWSALDPEIVDAEIVDEH